LGRSIALEVIGQWRERLADISWFMRCLNEHIAREANREDGCKGRFWEGRFKSQALLDEKALLACMAYVDLNPIRAGLSETLEGSDFTSIQERIAGCVQSRDQDLEQAELPGGPTTAASCVSTASTVPDIDESRVPAAALMDFTGTAEQAVSGLPFHFNDYLELVDWTGRAVRADKRGFIPQDIPPILTRLGVEPESWIETVRHFRRHFFYFVGSEASLLQFSGAMGRSWLRGVGACRKLFSGGGGCKPATT